MSEIDPKSAQEFRDVWEEAEKIGAELEPKHNEQGEGQEGARNLIRFHNFLNLIPNWAPWSKPWILLQQAIVQAFNNAARN